MNHRPQPRSHLCNALLCNICLWHLADIEGVSLNVGFRGGRADMPYCTANVRL
jgi:hypothetical protein